MADPDFVWMVKTALDQGHSFGVDEIPAFEWHSTYAYASDTTMMEFLKDLKETRGVTDVTLDRLHKMMCSSEERYNVVSRILRKDLRCGIAAKTINKLSPGLVFRVSYQRCAGADHASKIDFRPGAILQLKANGMFAYLLPNGTFMTRKGETSKIEGNVIAPFIAELPGLNDKVLAVELVVLDECGCVMNRAVGNGLINAFFKGGGDPEIATKIRAFTWLYLTQEEFEKGEGKTPYRHIWESLTTMLPVMTGPNSAPPVKPISSWYVRTMDEAMEKTKEVIRGGEEGTVLKSMSEDFFWADEDPSYFQVKLKAAAEGEFVIVDAYEGDPNKKYAGLLGGITCRSKDGVIVSDCGIGFTDAQRKLGVDHWQAKKGQIMTGRFNGITEPNEQGIRALDHFVFVEERPDKTEADSYEDLRDTLLGVVE